MGRWPGGLGVTQRQVEAVARGDPAPSPPARWGKGRNRRRCHSSGRMSGWRRWTESCGFLSTSGICPNIR